MTSETNGAAGRRFASGVLPWLVAAGGLLVYLLTLNRWVSLQSVGTVARVSGWLWFPEVGQPLTGAILYPFRWLPQPWIPPALNLFGAVCAAAVLALLARSIALLPHDVRREDPFRKGREVAVLSTPSAWMPPVLAASLCGLQLSFWEQATAGTGEMIDLLVFAYIIRCLLEFRMGEDQSWLSRSALVYGAGMANNWAMVGFLPVFLAAILRTKGLSPFLNVRFLLRMALWGLAGLSLYLLLPALQSFSVDGRMDFWTALKVHLQAQKGALTTLRTPAVKALALTSLLPLLVLSIRWKSHTVQFGDDSPLGVFLTKATGHLVHGLFLAASLWIALDPSFGPRHLDLGTPMLTYYYISALVFGYCAGYFLLLGSGAQQGEKFGGYTVATRFRGSAAVPSRSGDAGRARGTVPRTGACSGMLRLGTAALRDVRASTLGVAAAWVLLAAVPLGLAWKNLGQIRMTNGPAMREFARQAWADLPAGKCVVLSDESGQLLLLKAELCRHGGDKDALLLDAPLLGSAQYQSRMARQFGSRWPAVPPTNRLAVVEPDQVRDLISGFAAREPVVYLQPSFGYLFEAFGAEPKGITHQLVARAQGQRLEARVVASNQQTWEERWRGGLQSLARHTKEKPREGPRWARSVLRGLRLSGEQNLTALFLGAAYSKSLNDWGVRLQRLGRWREAGEWFQRAVELNPENLAARINAEYNERWQRGNKARLNVLSVRERFPALVAKYNNWGEVLSCDGPLDEPTFLFRTARMLLAGGNSLQAAGEFARCAELAPEWAAPRLWLAQSQLELRDFASALEMTEGIQGASAPVTGAGLAQLLECRTMALRGLERTNEAAAWIDCFVTQHREQGEVLSTAAELYGQSRQFEPELAVLDELLRREPNRPDLLAKKGFAELRLSRRAAAIATLSAALALAPSNTEARLQRAVACLEAGQWEAAREDYQQLLTSTNHCQNALFGLGAIAWRQQDTNAAIECYERFLSNAVPESPQYAVATERLQQLKRRNPGSL